MKNSCDIIRDLLPMYAEHMTSRASSELVDEHLMNCDACRTFLNDLRRPAAFSEEIPIHTLSRVKKHIQKRRILTAVLAVLLVVSLYVNVQTVLNAQVYLTADQAVKGVEQREDGTFEVQYWGYVSGMGSIHRDEAPGNVGVLGQTRLRNLLKERDPDLTGYHGSSLDEEGVFSFTTADPETANVWYYNWRNGKPETLLWDGGAPHPDPDFTFENMNYKPAYYCAAAAIFCVVFAVSAWVKRERGAGKWLRFFALAFGCSCAAILCTSGGQFVDVGIGIPSKVIDGITPFVPMLLTGLCAFSLYDMQGQALLSEEEGQSTE